MNRPRLPLLAALAALLLAAGCGGSSGGDPSADPAAIAPARATIYAEASLKHDDDVDAIARKLAGVDDPGAELRKAFETWVNKGGRRDFSWEKDVAPWIGDRVGFFITEIDRSGEDAQGAVVATVEDSGKAQKFLDEEVAKKDAGDEKAPQVTSRTYKGETYKVDTANDNASIVLGDYALTGTEQGIKAAIDAKDGETLADADAFEKARDQVDQDATAFGYVKVSALLGALGPQGMAASQVLGQFGDAVALSVSAEKDAIDVETASIGGKGGAGSDPGALLTELPGDSWLAFGTADIGKQLAQALQQFSQLSALGGTDLESMLSQVEKQTGIDVRDDVLSWMGDGALFVRGTGLTDIGGALVVKSTDPAKTKALVPKLRRLLGSLPGVRVSSLDASGVDAGLTVRTSDVPLPIHVAAAGDRFIVAVTDGALQAALDPGSKLGDAAAFKAAADRLGDGVKPSLFVDMAPVRRLVDGSGQLPKEPGAQRFRKALDHVTTIAAGGKAEGDVRRGRFSVGVK